MQGKIKAKKTWNRVGSRGEGPPKVNFSRAEIVTGKGRRTTGA
jgi:hypothetical protein